MLKKRLIDLFISLKTKFSSYSPEIKVIIVMALACLVLSIGYAIRSMTSQEQVAEITEIPATPPIVPPVINWQTPSVSLIAEKIEITTNTQGEGYLDKVFLADPANISNFTLHSDAPDRNRDYTTLEATWTENNVEMRLYMYFEAYLDGSARKWRLTQVRTYNGNNPGNWVDSYSGGTELFTPTLMGSTLYIPYVELSTSGGGYFHLKFTNLRLQAFLEESSNCIYQNVQCFQAPCDPILVCNSPSPSPSTFPSPSPSLSPACTRQSPSISINPANQIGYPGQTLTYNVSITNRDSGSCGPSNFGFGTMTDYLFTASPSIFSNYIPAGGTFNTTFTATSPVTNPWNEQRSVPVSFAATNFASQLNSSINASYTLLMPRPQTLNFKIKLAGVTDNKAEGAKVTIKFYLQDGSVRALSEPLTLTYGSQGIYKASATLSNPLPAGTGFSVLVKGEKHVATRYCMFSGQTTHCGYNQSMAYGPVSGDIFFDFTGLPLSPGDLPLQDGKVDINDLNKLKPLMGKSQSSLTEADLLVGDVNYDNFINIYDVFLILKTVETRYDD